MKVIGLTGGIGSGKSSVASFFSLIGVPVYKADDAAKNLMISDSLLRLEIIKLFGETAYEKDGLNRKFIADRVFPNPELLRQLNSIVHPAVKRDFATWINQQQASYVIREAAILFESGSYQDCDKIITVSAPEEERINRVVLRDSLPKAAIVERIRNQWSDEEKIKLSNYVIKNFTNHLVIPQVLNIHRQIIQ